MGVEWFEDIARNQRMVNTGVLVRMEAFEILLPNIHHCGKQNGVKSIVLRERWVRRDCGCRVQEFREVPFQGRRELQYVGYQGSGGMTLVGPRCSDRD